MEESEVDLLKAPGRMVHKCPNLYFSLSSHHTHRHHEQSSASSKYMAITAQPTILHSHRLWSGHLQPIDRPVVPRLCRSSTTGHSISTAGSAESSDACGQSSLCRRLSFVPTTPTIHLRRATINVYADRRYGRGVRGVIETKMEDEYSPQAATSSCLRYAPRRQGIRRDRVECRPHRRG